MSSVSLVSLNCFQIPHTIIKLYCSFGDYVPIQACKDQTERAYRTIEMIQNHDIFLLQEMWGASMDIFYKNIKNHYHIPNKLSDFIWHDSICFKTVQRFLMECWNTAYSYLRQNGGLFSGSIHGLQLVWYYHHCFEHNEGEKSMNKSLGISLIDMKEKWGNNKYLLAINAHYSSPNPFDNTNERNTQRTETIQIFSTLSALCKFPEMFEWSNCAVIFAGDFNVAMNKKHSLHERSDEYLEMLEQFKEYNIVNMCEHITQYTYNEQNKYVCSKTLDDCAILDYVFNLKSFYDSNTDTYVPTLPIIQTSSSLVGIEYGEEYSDHYGISVNIKPII